MKLNLDAESESPEWHGDILRETERLIQQGKAKFSPMDEAKRRINRKIANIDRKRRRDG